MQRKIQKVMNFLPFFILKGSLLQLFSYHGSQISPPIFTINVISRYMFIVKFMSWMFETEKKMKKTHIDSFSQNKSSWFIPDWRNHSILYNHGIVSHLVRLIWAVHMSSFTSQIDLSHKMRNKPYNLVNLNFTSCQIANLIPIPSRNKNSKNMF